MQTYFPRCKNVKDDDSAIKSGSVQAVQNELSSREPSIAVVVESINKLVSYKGRGFEEELVDVRRSSLDIPPWVQPAHPRGNIGFASVCRRQ